MLKPATTECTYPHKYANSRSRCYENTVHSNKLQNKYSWFDLSKVYSSDRKFSIQLSVCGALEELLLSPVVIDVQNVCTARYVDLARSISVFYFICKIHRSSILYFIEVCTSLDTRFEVPGKLHWIRWPATGFIPKSTFVQYQFNRKLLSATMYCLLREADQMLADCKYCILLLLWLVLCYLRTSICIYVCMKEFSEPWIGLQTIFQAVRLLNIIMYIIMVSRRCCFLVDYFCSEQFTLY